MIDASREAARASRLTAAAQLDCALSFKEQLETLTPTLEMIPLAMLPATPSGGDENRVLCSHAVTATGRRNDFSRHLRR